VSIYPDVMSAQKYLEIENNLKTDALEMPTINDIIDHLQEIDLTNSSDNDDDNIEQETIKISMNMGIEYGKNFLIFL
ncbi:338_t:CDS:1, partial [Acaulospora morrowiae]